MGDDKAVVQAARVSYGLDDREPKDNYEEVKKQIRTDRGLIRYLMRHRHTTPFEMCELKFLVRVPMDCWRQWIRHRTASVNEYSTRYTEAIDSRQTTKPDEWRTQSKTNKQGSAGVIDDASIKTSLTNAEEGFHAMAQQVYQNRLSAGVAKEQARKDLPLSTYTEAYWKIDLHNLFHFLSLRMDAHAQHEIRLYATKIGEIVEELFPMCWEAFVDYRLDALSLTGVDVVAIQAIRGGEASEDVLTRVFSNDREREECRAKCQRLGIIER